MTDFFAITLPFRTSCTTSVASNTLAVPETSNVDATVKPGGAPSTRIGGT